MPDLARVEQNSIGEVLSQTWRDASGNIVDPGTVTIGITRADGTTLLAAGTATSGGGAAARTYTLTTTHTSLLDVLTVVWTSSTYGPRTPEYVEVAGGFLFTVAEFRALGSAYANTTNYPTARVVEMRTTVEQALEDACSVAFVPRYAYETINGPGGYSLPLKWPKVRTVRSASYTASGTTTALTAGELALLTWADWGGLAGYGWTAGYGNWRVGYEHGHDRPPERIKRAALILAKRWITPGAADDRAINVTNESGTYALFQAGVRGHTFDVPEVQAAVDAYDLSVGVA